MNEPTPERRLYFPAYSETFALWMRNKIICAEFLKLKVEGKIELCFTDLKLQPHEIAKKLNVPEEEVSRILKD